MKSAFYIIMAAMALTVQFDVSWAASQCNSSYYQGCKSCADLERVTAAAQPNDGDYYRGAQWNGLYASYVLDCMAVAKDLLKRGANPNWGGSQGSMILSVSRKWPHNDERINRTWAALLLDYGANARKPVPDQEKSAEQIASDDVFAPDYPELFRMFLR